jgi:pectin methylesterase-like acyl-CoA thioesterase
MRAGLVILVTALVLPVANQAATKNQTATKQQNQKSRDNGVAQAIAFEKAKDAADVRQARIEAKHPTVFYTNSNGGNADREPSGQNVPDSGEAQRQDNCPQE